MFHSKMLIIIFNNNNTNSSQFKDSSFYDI